MNSCISVISLASMQIHKVPNTNYYYYYYYFNENKKTISLKIIIIIYYNFIIIRPFHTDLTCCQLIIKHYCCTYINTHTITKKPQFLLKEGGIKLSLWHDTAISTHSSVMLSSGAHSSDKG